LLILQSLAPRADGGQLLSELLHLALQGRQGRELRVHGHHRHQPPQPRPRQNRQKHSASASLVLVLPSSVIAVSLARL
jgi:hypothetical protein